MSTRILHALLIAVVAFGAVAGVAAADGDLAVTVDDVDAEPVVTVTHNGTAVENASVTVETVDENASYDGVGDYTTDEDGTVTLPVADEDVTVNVTATHEDETTTEEVDLEAPDSASGLAVNVTDTDAEPTVTVSWNGTGVENASVNVTIAEDGNVTYVGEGDYETDANGTATIPAAEENVTVDVTAAYEDETATTTATLTVAEGTDEADEEVEGFSFGQTLREFIADIEDRSSGIGGAVSDFVTSNNPGNAPDHAGSPANETANASDAPGNSGERGAPAHAGGSKDGGSDDGDSTDADSNDADSTNGESTNGESTNGGSNDGGSNDAASGERGGNGAPGNSGGQGPPEHAG